MIESHNRELERFESVYSGLARRERDERINGFIEADPTQISWTRALKQDLARGDRQTFKMSEMRQSLYRPFTKHWLYADRSLNEAVSFMPQLFPGGDEQNLAIGVTASASRDEYSVLMVSQMASFHSVDMVGSQFFPLYVYTGRAEEPEEAKAQQALNLSEEPKAAAPMRRDGITDAGLAHFQAAYFGEAITKEDVFYYVYGLLHSPDYRERFADNLGKELPRIPCVKKLTDFRTFSTAGRELAKLHVNYESVAPYPATIDGGAKPLQDADYRVEKMKFGKSGKDKDRTTIHYNERITISGIPPEAYDYVVNGKPAIEWVMERQAVKIDKDSGIVSDANDWATETVGNPRYLLELLLRVVTVSLETMKIVKGLPVLDI